MTHGSRTKATGRPAPPVEERFLTIREAGEILQMHPRTVREYVRRGELRGGLIDGRWRFRREDIEAFFDAAPAEWEFREGSGCGE